MQAYTTGKRFSADSGTMHSKWIEADSTLWSINARWIALPFAVALSKEINWSQCLQCVDGRAAQTVIFENDINASWIGGLQIQASQWWLHLSAKPNLEGCALAGSMCQKRFQELETRQCPHVLDTTYTCASESEPNIEHKHFFISLEYKSKLIS